MSWAGGERGRGREAEEPVNRDGCGPWDMSTQGPWAQVEVLADLGWLPAPADNAGEEGGCRTGSPRGGCALEGNTQAHGLHGPSGGQSRALVSAEPLPLAAMELVNYPLPLQVFLERS